MEYEILTADITTREDTVILHGCNCQGKMASGVAKALRDKFPSIYPPYRDYVEQARAMGSQQQILGTIVPVVINQQVHVINGLTQYFYGYDKAKYADLGAIKSVLEKTLEYAKMHAFQTVTIPKIGCALGGLSWENEVEPLIRTLPETPILLIVCQL